MHLATVASTTTKINQSVLVSKFLICGLELGATLKTWRVQTFMAEIKQHRVRGGTCGVPDVSPNARVEDACA